MHTLGRGSLGEKTLSRLMPKVCGTWDKSTKGGAHTILAQNLEIISHTSNLLNSMCYSLAFTKTFTTT